MLYGVKDTPKTIRELGLYALQQVLAIFVATVLIAQICGTPIDACLFGACLATILYQCITGFRSPMFISSCGATTSAVIGALAIGGGNNHLAVAIGGAVIFVVYAIFSCIVRKFGVSSLNKIFPPCIVGPVTIVIGLNLATYINSYVAINGAHSDIGVLVAVFTMLVVAVSSHYFKGFWKTIPFLIGLGSGYLLSAILTLCGVEKLIDFSVFKDIGFFNVPDFSFMHWDFGTFTWDTIWKVLVLFVPVAICALLEHYSDHKVLSNIIGTDLAEDPGLHKTLLGDGLASFVGTICCSLPNTSYGESLAVVGFSKVASVKVISVAALFTGALAFISPVQAFIGSVPACVFGGCAMVLYGYIAASGLKTIINSKVNLNNNKNLIIVSVILTVGVSGVFIFHEATSGVALAMILGVLLNLILKEKKK